MRSISAGLASAQAVRSPKVTISATITARGLSPDAPAIAWSELKAPSGTPPFYVSAGIFFSPTVYRLKATATYIQVQTVDLSSPDADDWHASNGWSNLISGKADALACARASTTAGRIYWVRNADGYVVYNATSDSGSSWGSTTSDYSGGDAVWDVVADHVHAESDLAGYVTGVSTYDGGTGTYAAYFKAGGSYVKYAENWRAAGIYVDPDDDAYVYPLVFRPNGEGPSRLRKLRFEGATFDQAVDIDQTQSGLLGLSLLNYKSCQAVSSDAWHPIISMESAYGGDRVVGYGSVFKSADSLQCDEALMFPAFDSYNDRVYQYIVDADADAYDKYFFFDSIAVYEGTKQDATTGTITPISYSYDESHLHLVAEKAEQDTATIEPGQLLTLRRTLRWGADTGSEDLIFMVVSVRVSKQYTRIHAVDPLGYLGIMRCHRPCVINDGNADGLTQCLQRLAARVGLPLASDHSGIDSLDVLPFVLQPSESLLGAAYRLTNQDNAWLVPENSPTWAITAITPGASTSGDYDDTAHTYPSGQWDLIDAEEVSDGYRLAFSYVLGTKSTDPEDGAYVAMSVGPALDNFRPIPYSITNTRFNSQTRVQDAAAAEATRQNYLPVDAVVTLQADLSLELYDVIEVSADHLGWTDKAYRVRRIREVYDRGRLHQILYCGEDP